MAATHLYPLKEHSHLWRYVWNMASDAIWSSTKIRARRLLSCIASVSVMNVNCALPVANFATYKNNIATVCFARSVASFTQVFYVLTCSDETIWNVFFAFIQFSVAPTTTGTRPAVNKVWAECLDASDKIWSCWLWLRCLFCHSIHKYLFAD